MDVVPSLIIVKSPLPLYSEPLTVAEPDALIVAGKSLSKTEPSARSIVVITLLAVPFSSYLTPLTSSVARRLVGLVALS